MMRLPVRSSSLFVLAFASAAWSGLPLNHAAAQEVVQPLPDPAAATLNDALRRLSRNPDSVPALVAAGRASLELDDTEAAFGFFTRAQAEAPGDSRVMSGLALVAVRRGDAVTALQLFRNAEAAGAPLSEYAAERGLAYDLVGRNDRAQRLYRLALSQDENPEVLRRLALSYAIAGDFDASEATLLPLLQRQDRAAYRTRAFVLAIRGRDEEAIAIAETMLPARLSLRLAPYLRYMPRLTRAQQAAAANLGNFPAANEVGRDSPEIAALAEEGEAAAPRPFAQRGAERLTPSGEPLGPSAPTAQASGELPPVAQETQIAQADPPPPPSRPPSPVVAATLGNETAGTEPEDIPSTVAPVAQSSIQTVDPAPSGVASASPAEREVAAEAPIIDLREAFADIAAAPRETPANADAVDITSIQPRRETPRPVEPPRPVHPSRHWVQVATGRDTSAFRFDWRRIERQAGTVLEGAEAYTAHWGETNRLLTGPFDTTAQAQEMVSMLAGEGVDAFRFTSAEGEEIQSLD
ncbi:CHAT domain-containing protein [Aurantiacibacter poecillastricola]|uniref:CHAT domain-containing protein n=1 Tax=Aurantiacibacter poecillastricola TaxID=3064385 RepID=UPI00273D16C5|nr:SPOR domain-containing protein [Aurantiacibacter sp. 219JJ12-13]MDP5262892.1 SPOR domain-containing protein [Aurantiacibacter sp. 219JJ12-13]